MSLSGPRVLEGGPAGQEGLDLVLSGGRGLTDWKRLGTTAANNSKLGRPLCV